MSHQEKREIAQRFNEARDAQIANKATAENIAEFLKQRFDANLKLGIQQGEGFQILYGPFPSFLIHIKNEVLTLSIDVTADAPTMVAMAIDLTTNFPGIQYGGCFVFDPDDMSKMVVDPVACYDMKLVHMKRMLVSHLAAQAAQKAVKDSQEPGIILPESKIILNPSQA